MEGVIEIRKKCMKEFEREMQDSKMIKYKRTKEGRGLNGSNREVTVVEDREEGRDHNGILRIHV